MQAAAAAIDFAAVDPYRKLGSRTHQLAAGRCWLQELEMEVRMGSRTHQLAADSCWLQELVVVVRTGRCGR